MFFAKLYYLTADVFLPYDENKNIWVLWVFNSPMDAEEYLKALHMKYQQIQRMETVHNGLPTTKRSFDFFKENKMTDKGVGDFVIIIDDKNTREKR